MGILLVLTLEEKDRQELHLSVFTLFLPDFLITYEIFNTPLPLIVSEIRNNFKFIQGQPNEFYAGQRGLFP